MRYVNGSISLIFLILTGVHLAVHPGDHVFCSALLGLGAVLAIATLKEDMHLVVVRVMAVATVAVMFVFFAGFFQMVPKLDGDWYRDAIALEGLSLIIPAFALIPVLSDYSCRLKAECREYRRSAGHSGKARRPAFFSSSS